MQEYADEILSELRSILDKHKGFILFSDVAKSLSKGLRSKLYIKSNTPPKIIKQKLMPVIEENFIIRKKTNAIYVLTPCEMEELVFMRLSETEAVPLGELVRLLKPFTKAEALALVTEMVNAGKVRVEFPESYRVNVFAWGAGHQAVSESRQAPVQALSPEEYTQAKFRAAYDVLHTFRKFVRICDMRRSLNWPREVFDGMVRALRDNRTIQLFMTDESHMTKDEIRDCFIDENRFIQGLMTWNGR